ncbi:MAG: hypothetical protein CMP56_04885 [Flavobacteriales bacterium]|nr:hypothetical protein [Flavobacteriales bacterium]
MAKLLRFSFIIFSILLYAGCGALQEKSKDKYITDYEIFVKEVRVLHENFTDEEWEECYLKYEEFSVAKKKKHAKYFTESDIKKIDLLEEEYASYLIEQEINDFIESLGKGIKKGIEEIGDFIDETAKDFEEWSNEESDLDSIK